MKNHIVILLAFFIACSPPSQQEHHHEIEKEGIPIIERVEAQPLIAQAVRISEGLDFVGSALPAKVKTEIEAIAKQAHSKESVISIQQLLDPFCLAYVEINPESRVKLKQGKVPAVLHQEGWTSFLVKVNNQANITAALVPESPNALPVLHQSTYGHRMKKENQLSPGEIDNRFLEMELYKGRPVNAQLSGLEVQYFIIQFYTKATGKREVKLGFNVGQGTQDLGFRNTIDVLFDIKKSVKVLFDVVDFDGSSTMASFLITNGVAHYPNAKEKDYRVAKASSTHWMEGLGQKAFDLPAEQQLIGIFPLPSRRLATEDEFPDFFFQPQIYRTSGEHVFLPSGSYQVTYGRGPEYLEQSKKIVVPENVDSVTLSFQLQRWIHMAQQNWYSADHHIHASGCSHYESPEEGVLPEHMWRQVLGEDLNMGNNLTWGPSWYFQKQFFTGQNHELSDKENILRYDVEVSGFPSSHAGHLVLLNLNEDDYPNTTTIEEWPSWTLPVLQWAKNQEGITGYAHSGWGLSPNEPTIELPNYVLPKMDGIGANEYIVTVAHEVIDFFSAGDTPLPAELNMWYHTLNSGFKIPLSGETDFPCISDEKVGRARIYANLEKGLDFKNYMDALLHGKSYVSTGKAHLIDFQINGLSLGEENSQLKLAQKERLNIKVNAAAFLSEEQNEIEKTISNLNLYQSPYWHIERSRIGQSRKVAVELIVNGEKVDQQEIIADGSWNDLNFNFEIKRSSWVSFRIFGSAHTNPIFIEVAEQPIRILKSLEWCRATVDQCWKMKKDNIRKSERADAQKGYDFARALYDRRIKQASN